LKKAQKEKKKKHVKQVQLVTHPKTQILKYIKAKMSNGKYRKYKPDQELPKEVFKMLPHYLKKKLKVESDKPINPNEINIGLGQLKEMKITGIGARQMVNYGVALGNINLSDPGQVLFPNQLDKKHLTHHSSHDIVLNNSKWSSYHMYMDREYNDKAFDLSNKLKCLYGNLRLLDSKAAKQIE
jgi:hypothetical protein